MYRERQHYLALVRFPTFLRSTIVQAEELARMPLLRIFDPQDHNCLGFRVIEARIIRSILCFLGVLYHNYTARHPY